MIKKLIITITYMSILLSSQISAKAVAPDQQIPVDVRRTTFIVNDAEKSLKLYRDALGLTVIYDQMIEWPMVKPENAV